MRIFVVFAILLVLNSCTSKTTEEFIERNKNDFKPFSERSNAKIYEKHNIVIFEKFQNYIKKEGVLKKIALRKQGKLGVDYKDNATVNYQWRNIDDYNKNFNDLFAGNVVICNSYFHIDRGDYHYGEDRNDKNIIPYIAMTVIEEDTNKNNVFDDENDIRSIYLFDIKNKTIKRITPQSINVAEIKYIGFTSKESLVKAVYNTKENNNIFELKNFIILFEGKDLNEKKTNIYMYHIKNGIIENISNLLN